MLTKNLRQLSSHIFLKGLSVFSMSPAIFSAVTKCKRITWKSYKAYVNQNSMDYTDLKSEFVYMQRRETIKK